MEDIGIKPVRLTVTGEPVVHSQIANGSYLGILRKGSVAEVVAIVTRRCACAAPRRRAAWSAGCPPRGSRR